MKRKLTSGNIVLGLFWDQEYAIAAFSSGHCLNVPVLLTHVGEPQERSEQRLLVRQQRKA